METYTRAAWALWRTLNPSWKGKSRATIFGITTLQAALAIRWQGIASDDWLDSSIFLVQNAQRGTTQMTGWVMAWMRPVRHRFYEPRWQTLSCVSNWHARCSSSLSGAADEGYWGQWLILEHITWWLPECWSPVDTNCYLVLVVGCQSESLYSQDV